MKTIMCVILLVVAAFWSGCSSGTGGALDRTTSASPARTTVMDSARQLAMQHFIDGSLEEVKGDFAKAILEFQDALRYDKDPAIYYALSKNYSLLGKHSLAIEAAREAVRRGPEEMTYRRYSDWREVARLLFYCLVEHFPYRQMTMIWRLQGLYQYLRGDMKWREMKRIGLPVTPAGGD